jgi:hypothetical protein
LCTKSGHGAYKLVRIGMPERERACGWRATDERASTRRKRAARFLSSLKAAENKRFAAFAEFHFSVVPLPNGS